jgi:hypothetical protein
MSQKKLKDIVEDNSERIEELENNLKLVFKELNKIKNAKIIGSLKFQKENQNE